MKKVLLFVCLCIVLCVPTFAATGSHFYSSPFTVNLQYDDGNGNVTNGSVTFTGPEGTSFYLSCTNASASVFCISHVSSPGIVSWSGTNALGSPVSGSSSEWSVRRYTGYSNCFTCSCTSFNFDDLNGLYTWFDFPTNSDVIVPAYSDFLVNGNPSDPSNPTPAGNISTFTLPRGNVVYFKVSSASDVNMISHMPTLNNLVQFGNNSLGPWGDTGQRWGYASSLPDSSTSFPLSSQVPLTWTKDASQNILGQTKIGHATKACTTGQWYVFFNPGVSGMSANGLNDIAGASVDFSGYFSEVKVFPLSERLDYSNPLGGTFESYSDDGYASYFDATINENGGAVTWENQDGQISSPAIGGQNAQYGDLSTDGLIKRVQEYLANILNEIKSLFTFGYEAIQSLVGIMSDFVNVFQGLYSWLPQPVHAALVSAVSVAVVIGVFKVFL